MSLPYATATSGQAALTELSRILGNFGCQSFGTMENRETGELLVQFTWKGRSVSLAANWKGYALLWLRQNPWSSRKYSTKLEYESRALKQAQISVCSILRDWVKSQVTAIECGILEFEAAFLSHLMLPNGQRIIEMVREKQMLPRLEEVGKQ